MITDKEERKEYIDDINFEIGGLVNTIRAVGISNYEEFFREYLSFHPSMAPDSNHIKISKDYLEILDLSNNPLYNRKILWFNSIGAILWKRMQK